MQTATIVAVPVNAVPDPPFNVCSQMVCPAGFPLIVRIGCVVARVFDVTPSLTEELEGATPAPPPFTSTFAVSAADDAHVLELEKYGMPPLLPEMLVVTAPVALLLVMIVPSPEKEVTAATPICAVMLMLVMSAPVICQ